MIVWLASYPRSGNTLLRTLIYQTMKLGSYSDELSEVPFRVPAPPFEHFTIPDGDWGRFYREASHSPQLHLVKTHRRPRDAQPAIYIRRDGRNTLVSYARFHRDMPEGSGLTTLKLALGVDYYGSWANHYLAWTRRSGPLLTVSYEELSLSPEKLLPQIAAFVGYKGKLRPWRNPFESLRAADPRFYRQGHINWTGDPEWTALVDGVFFHLQGEVMLRCGYATKEEEQEAVRAVPEEVLRITESLEEQLGLCAAMQEALDLRQAVANDLHATASERLAEIGRLNAACNARQAVIQGLKRDCDERLAEIGKLKAVCDERQLVIDGLKRECDERLAGICKLKATCDERQLLIDGLKRGYDERSAEIEALKLASDARQKHTDRLTNASPAGPPPDTGTRRIGKPACEGQGLGPAAKEPHSQLVTWGERSSPRTPPLLLSEPPSHLADANLQDCWFYHSLDLPKSGHQPGQWDLRGRFDDYVLNVDVKDKSVLDVGTASGFISFEASKRGAKVVSFDADHAWRWNRLPFPDDCNPSASSAWEREAEKELDRMKRGYWLARSELVLRTVALYGDVYSLSPETVGLFDVVVVGQVLVHLRDPIRALTAIASCCRDTLVIAEGMILDERPVSLFLGSASDHSNERSFWWHSREFYVRLMEILGLELQRTRTSRYLSAVLGKVDISTLVFSRA